MGISTSNPDLMRAILAMDAYNRGYNAGIKSPGAGAREGLTGTKIGEATLLRRSNIDVGSNEVNASFFAQAYTLGGKTVISYRGTDTIQTLTSLLTSRDVPGFATGAGLPDTTQTRLAADFYRSLNGGVAGPSGDIVLTGHSLGGT
jgi:hypothetical protein